jgi:tRNA A37 threonylcarbamoyladenosine dehydratase
MSINPFFERLALIATEAGIEKLRRSSVLVFGAGGVGSWAAEALVRCGIGKLGIIDYDIICASNVNRQIEATSLTVGQAKAAALQKRLLEINPECKITAWNDRFCRENAGIFGIKNVDYVIDAIDSIEDKLDLIQAADEAGVKIYSSMGMALRVDPSRIKIADIQKTRVCPLARLVRQGLRKRGFTKGLTVVYNDEEPRRDPGSRRALEPRGAFETRTEAKRANGSLVTVTASAGLLLANLVLRDITGL